MRGWGWTRGFLYGGVEGRGEKKTKLGRKGEGGGGEGGGKEGGQGVGGGVGGGGGGGGKKKRGGGGGGGGGGGVGVIYFGGPGVWAGEIDLVADGAAETAAGDGGWGRHLSNGILVCGRLYLWKRRMFGGLVWADG